MRTLLSIFAVVGVVALAAPPGASAQFGVDPDDWIAQVFGTDVEDFGQATDEYGEDGIYAQAGGHAWKGITDFTMRLDGSGEPEGGNAARVRVDVPPGLVPNPTIFPRCPRATFDADPGGCPADSQIGIEEITLKEGLAVARVRVPLYNVGIEPDELALFGFHAADAAPLVPAIAGLADVEPVEIVGGVRDEATARPDGGVFGPHDNGLFFTIDDAPDSPSVLRSKLTFWGVPGDVDHDAQRGQACATVIEPVPAAPACSGGGEASTVRELPFLSSPTKCGGVPLETRLSLWSFSDVFATVVTRTPTLPDPDDGGILKDGAQRCERVPFDGDIDLVPDTTAPDSPVGPAVTLTVPQPGLEDWTQLTTSHVKDAAVTLPPGMTLNPSAANGLVACTDAQLAAGTGTVGGDECPEASRIGAVDVKSPLLPDSVVGSAFVGQPLPGDMYRVFLTLEGRGASIRLKGSVTPDPATGQLTATFADNPEQPFETFTVDLEDGPLAPLANPLDCGPKTASATLSPWSGTAAIAPSSDPFAVAGASCPAGFAPGFGAATADGRSGAYAPLSVSLGRDDGDQFLGGVRVETPPGLAGKIRGVDQCPDSLARTGSCPAASRIGTVSTRAGAGPRPFALSGPVYLTEGFDGAPFGMAVAIRAIAGPYDLGTVVVRQRIFVDDEDAHLSVISDPLPRILEGVPIRLRDVAVTLDRDDFVYNPTACGERLVDGRLSSTAGTTVDRAARLTFHGCERLGFGPRLRMRLRGARQLRFGGHPSLVARVRQGGGQANIARARVKLPASLALDPRNSQKVCSVEDAAEADCPKETRIGFARAVSPVLNRPLRGPVHLVQGIRVDPESGAEIRTLPSLLAKLGGEIRINLRGTTDVVGRRSNLVSTFAAVPDAPVSDFAMRVRGGKRGILVVTGRRGACRRGQRNARVGFHGHNGKRAGGRTRIGMRKPCRRLRRLQRRQRQRRRARQRGAAATAGATARAAS